MLTTSSASAMDRQESVPDYQMHPGNLDQAVGAIKLGKVRTFRIPNSQTETHIVPFHVEGHGKICFTTTKFAAPGVYQQDPAKQTDKAGAQPTTPPSTQPRQLSLMVTKDTSGSIFSNLHLELMNCAYPQLLEQIRAFEESEANHNRSLPPFLRRVLTDGIAGKETHVKPLWSDKDVTYVKITADALVFSKPSQFSLIESRTAGWLASEGRLPHRGTYQARVVPRYLYLGPSQNTMRVQLTLMLDQVLYMPDEAEAPNHAVMDLDSFFQSVPEHNILQQAIEAAGLPVVPLGPQKPPPKLKQTSLPAATPTRPPAKTTPLAAPTKPPAKTARPVPLKRPVTGKPSSYIKSGDEEEAKRAKQAEAHPSGDDEIDLTFLE